MLVGREKGRMGEALVVQVTAAKSAGMGTLWTGTTSFSIPQSPWSEGETFLVVVRKTADQTVSASHQ